MFSKARRWLAHLRPAQSTRLEEARFDGQMEELEPRILFSADAAGVLAIDPAATPAAAPSPDRTAVGTDRAKMHAAGAEG